MDKTSFVVLQFSTFLFHCLLAFPRNYGNASNCTIRPSAGTIPCTQYTFEGDNACNETELSARFPKLYISAKGEFAKWPGPPKLLGKQSSNITWRPSVNGGIHYLKGFQIILYGASFESFGKTLCTVVNLNRNEEEPISQLLNATFEAHFNDPGDFLVTVQSLPLPNKGYTQKIENVFTKTNYTYHPNITVDIDVVQLNESSINVTIDITPEIEEISNYLLEAYYHSDQRGKLREQFKVISPSENSYTVLGNLKTGNYTLKLQPENRYNTDPRRCVCYTGKSSQRSCVPCITYSKAIQIESDLRNSNKNPTPVFLLVGVPVIVATLLLLLTIAVGLLLRRAKIIHYCAGTDKAETNRKKVICVLYTTDNQAHDEVIQAFVKYLETISKCSIISQADLTESREKDNAVHQLLSDADLIVYINSEAAHKLYMIHKKESHNHLQQTFGRINENFILCTAMLVQKQNSNLRSKTLSVQFDYTSKYFHLEDISACNYILLKELNEFKQHVKEQIKPTDMRVADDYSMCTELAKSITACKYFQSSNPTWFNDTYRHITKSSFSSDDSGVEVHNNLLHSSCSQKCYSSISNVCHDSEITSYRHFKHNNINRSTLPQRIYRSASMQTGSSSFCVSEVEKRFISPEFGDEKEDTPTVLLTDQMRQINSRYDYNVNNQFDTDDDCFTVLGTSV